MIVGDILKNQDGQIRACAPDNSLIEAAKILREHRVGLLVVMKVGRTVGVLSERDIIRVIADQGVDGLHQTVAGTMTTDIVSCPANTPVDEGLELMHIRGIRHLLVADGGLPLGVVSLRDIARFVGTSTAVYEL